MADKHEMKRKRRLQKIQAHLAEALREVIPGSAGDYKIVYKPIKKYHTTTFGSRDVEVSPSQSPAYGFFLVLADAPRKKYPIMHLFREDVNRRVLDKDIRVHYNIPRFKENIQNGIEALEKSRSRTKGKKSGDGGLERTLKVISVSGLLLSIFFLSYNFTGFTIFNLTQTTSNIIGVVLFLVGLVGAFFILRKYTNLTLTLA